MGKTVLFVIGILMFSMLAAVSGTSGTLVLKEKSVVSGEIVRVKDVALMEPGVMDRVGQLIISVSPELGKSISIQKQEIYEKLVGNGVQPIEIKGPSSITVLRKGTVLKSSFFKESIYEYITTHSKWKDGLQVEIVTTKEVVIPESGFRWQINPANGQDFFGNVLFEVKAISTDTNEVLYSGWVTAKLKIVKDVPVTNHEIQRNQVITDADIRWESREVTPFTKDVILEKSELIGRRSDRFVRANTVLTTSLLEKEFMVRRGETAVLVAQTRNVSASTHVKVLADGCIGDPVQVMNLVSKRIITAVVNGKNSLEVRVE